MPELKKVKWKFFQLGSSVILMLPHCAYWSNRQRGIGSSFPTQNDICKPLGRGNNLVSVAIGPGRQLGICSHWAGEVFTNFNP